MCKVFIRNPEHLLNIEGIASSTGSLLKGRDLEQMSRQHVWQGQHRPMPTFDCDESPPRTVSQGFKQCCLSGTGKPLVASNKGGRQRVERPWQNNGIGHRVSRVSDEPLREELDLSDAQGRLLTQFVTRWGRPKPRVLGDQLSFVLHVQSGHVEKRLTIDRKKRFDVKRMRNSIGGLRSHLSHNQA